MEAFVDIEGPVRLGLPAWPFVAAGLILLGLLAGFLLWRRRGARAVPAAVAPPPRPPRQVAMERLQKLRERMTSLAAEPFTVEVSGILRQFIEDEFRLPAQEQTTEEFLGTLTQKERLPNILKERMPAFLENCDRVKFARQSLAEPEKEHLLETGRAVIEAAASEPDPESEPSQETLRS